MFKSIIKKMKEKILKLKNEKDNIQLPTDNKEKEQKKLNLGEIKELNECLNLINRMKDNINELKDNQLEQSINLINLYLNKYRNEYYLEFEQVRDCIIKLQNLKSDIELKMIYGEEKVLLNVQEIEEITECLNFIDNVTINMYTFDNIQLQKNIDLIDCYLNKYRDNYYTNYTLIRKTIRKLNNVKSDMLIKIYYENESEEEKVYLKCC